MVATTRSWIYDLNRDDQNPDTTLGPANQGEQYSNSVLNFKRFLVGQQPVDLTGAWTVDRSCDSVTAPDATDQWTDASKVVFGVDGSQPLSWIVLKAPSGLQGVNDVWLLIVADNTNADANPDKVDMYVSNAAYTGGSTTARPTTTGTENTLVSNIWLKPTFAPHTTHGLRNETGEFWFVVSEDGTLLAEMGIGCVRPENGEATAYPAALYRSHSIAGGLTLNALEAVANWEGWWTSGATSLVGLKVASVVREASVNLWTNGLSDISSAAPDGFIDLLNNQTNFCLYVGRIVDIRACPSNVVGGSEQSGDTDPIVRFCIGGLWVPLPTGTALIL